MVPEALLEAGEMVTVMVPLEAWVMVSVLPSGRVRVMVSAAEALEDDPELLEGVLVPELGEVEGAAFPLVGATGVVRSGLMVLITSLNAFLRKRLHRR